MLGDFNIQINNLHSNGCSSKFIKYLDNFNFQQYVNFPSHVAGNILDLIITTTSSNIISNVICSDLFSDNCIIKFNLECTKPSYPKRTIKYRKLSCIDINKFMNTCNLQIINNVSDIPYIDKLIQALTISLDTHVPLKSLSILDRPIKKWYNGPLAEHKRILRKCERTYKKCKSASNLINLCNTRKPYNKLINHTKQEYYKSLLDNTKDSKLVFNVCNNLLVRKKKSNEFNTNLCILTNEFADFFPSKVSKLIASFPTVTIGKDGRTGSAEQLCVNSDTITFDYFSMPSYDLLLKLLLSSKTSPSADPIPTRLLKNCSRLLKTYGIL